MITQLADIARKDGFIFVGALIPIKVDGTKIKVDEEREGGQFTNFGDQSQISHWLRFAAAEATMNDAAVKMANQAIDKVNKGKAD